MNAGIKQRHLAEKREIRMSWRKALEKSGGVCAYHSLASIFLEDEPIESITGEPINGYRIETVHHGEYVHVPRYHIGDILRSAGVAANDWNHE